MTRCSVKWTFILLITATLTACSLSGNQQGESPQIPVDYEIGDVRSLSQDFTAYTSALHDAPPGNSCRESYLAEFRRIYYSPWTRKSPIFKSGDAVATMRSFAQKEWYGENKRRVPGIVLEGLLANCDLERFPSTGRPAVATAATPMRVLPTAKPLFEKPDGFPFDAMQNTGLKVNEPIRVLHHSRDGLWAFVESADTVGWVDSRDVGYMDETLARKWMKEEQVVIVRDLTLIRGIGGDVVNKAQLGAICPLVGEEGDDYLIIVAANASRLKGRHMRAKVAKEAARRFPQLLTGDSVALVGNELIGKPYGWGESFQDRDCSAVIRDFFLPFGIWLPRGSYNQIHSGRAISLAGLKGSEKERMIREKGVPFRTLVYMKGHIMLYVGNMKGRPLMFHSIWGVNVRDGNGGDFKHVIGKSIVSTMNPGSELDLASESIPARVSSMLVLGERCTPAGK